MDIVEELEVVRAEVEEVTEVQGEKEKGTPDDQGMDVGGDCEVVSQDGLDKEESRGEKEKNTPPSNAPVPHEESSLGTMSISSSGSMHPLESFYGSPPFPLHDPAITRLLAEAYRLG